MAEKFPMLSKQSSDCLREFLTAPSPILGRLSRHYNRLELNTANKKKNNLPILAVTESSDSIKSIKQGWFDFTTAEFHMKCSIRL